MGQNRDCCNRYLVAIGELVKILEHTFGKGDLAFTGLYLNMAQHNLLAFVFEKYLENPLVRRADYIFEKQFSCRARQKSRTHLKPSQLFEYFYGDGERPVVGV